MEEGAESNAFNQSFSDYSNRNKVIISKRKGEIKPMTKAETTKATELKLKSREAGAFTKRIGHTTYRVGVHFSDTSTETAQDKITRLVRMEAENGRAAVKQ